MKTVVKMFQDRFADLVESGVKTRTIRRIPKRMPKVGDRFSGRAWTGKPYRSKQRLLCESKVSSVENVKITDTGREMIVCVGGRCLEAEELNRFAVADGFNDAIDMFNWFESNHGFPFEGILIKWVQKKGKE